MKLFWKEILICMLMGLVVPGAFMEISEAVMEKQDTAAPDAAVAVVTPVTQHTEATESPTEPGPQIRVRQQDGSLSTMELEEYLVGVVLAEMPASFETEALKAQSVAARTYAGKAMLTGGKHGDGSICVSDQCCQAYLSPEEYVERGGMLQAVEKVRGAVNDTAGQVLTFDGQLIEATYFSCSGGSTEDARAVWGSDFPYLRAVESPGEQELFTETRQFSREKLEVLLGVSLPDDPEKWLGPEVRTPGDGVESLEIGGKTFSGGALRGLLGLRSTCFTASSGTYGLEICSRGYGHRVGMSQYGADAMAAAGKTCEEILSYYYSGTQIGNFDALLAESSGNLLHNE